MNFFSRWMNNINRRNNYHSLEDPAAVDQSQSIPGSFPDQGAESSDTNIMNPNTVRRKIKKLWHLTEYLLIRPFIIMIVVLLKILVKVFNILYIKILSFRGQNKSAALVNPQDRVEGFIADLKERLPPSQTFPQCVSDNDTEAALPPFFKGSHTQALYMATHRAKVLFVYLTNFANEKSEIFLKCLISNPEFVSLFKDPNNIIWGGDVTNPEAYQFANSLNATEMPFLGILCLTRSTIMSPQGPVKAGPKLSLISKVQGDLEDDVSKLINERFKRKMNTFEYELNIIRAELRNTFMSQVLVRRQNLKYETSLKKDRMKRRQKLELKQREEYLRWKARYFLQLQNENDHENKAKIAIKFTTGERETFFFPSNLPLYDLFTFVEVKRKDYFNNPELDMTDEEAKIEYKDFRVSFNFNLVLPLGRTIHLNEYLQNDPDVKIKDISYIYPKGLLLVEDH